MVADVWTRLPFTACSLPGYNVQDETDAGVVLHRRANRASSGAGACAVRASDGLGKCVVGAHGGVEEGKPCLGEGERWCKHPGACGGGQCELLTSGAAAACGVQGREQEVCSCRPYGPLAQNRTFSLIFVIKIIQIQFTLIMINITSN